MVPAASECVGRADGKGEGNEMEKDKVGRHVELGGEVGRRIENRNGSKISFFIKVKFLIIVFLL